MIIAIEELLAISFKTKNIAAKYDSILSTRIQCLKIEARRTRLRQWRKRTDTHTLTHTHTIHTHTLFNHWTQSMQSCQFEPQCTRAFHSNGRALQAK